MMSCRHCEGTGEVWTGKAPLESCYVCSNCNGTGRRTTCPDCSDELNGSGECDACKAECAEQGWDYHAA